MGSAGDHRSNGDAYATGDSNGVMKLEDPEKPLVVVETPNSSTVYETPKLYRRRWLMVALFAASSVTNAFQWIHLNIIYDKITVFYNESLPTSQYGKDLAIDWLSMVYMLAYIPLIFPSTWLLDRKGLRVVGIVATLLNALGAWIKCFAIQPHLFPLLMFAQVICAIAQVFILGVPARLAAVWFGPNEVSTATAIGVFGNQLGCALGFLIPPEIVKSSDEIAYQLKIMLYGGALLTSMIFLLVLIFFKNSPPKPPSLAQAIALDAAIAADSNYLASLKRLVENRAFVLLLVTYGLNTGSYYAIGTLLNPVILHYFPGEAINAGRIGLTLVASGVLGSILSGIWLDRTKLFKLTTVFIYVASFVGMLAFTFTLPLHKLWIVFVVSGVLGFFMTGYLPVGFEFAAEITFPESEGTSSGLLNASAQIFGIALTVITRALVVGVPNGNLAGNLTISAVLLLGVIGTGLIRSDLRRQKAHKKFSTALLDEKTIKSSQTSSFIVSDELQGTPVS